MPGSYSAIPPIVWNILGQYMTAQDAEDAEEVVADVFVSLWQYCKNPEAAKIRSYLGRIARSRAIDRLRQHKVELTLEYDELEFSTDSTETVILEQEQKHVLRQALMDMPPVYREIFIRHYYYCQSAVRIAADMGLKADTVRQRLRRGRMFLRQYFIKGGICDVDNFISSTDDWCMAHLFDEGSFFANGLSMDNPLADQSLSLQLYRIAKGTMTDFAVVGSASESYEYETFTTASGITVDIATNEVDYFIFAELDNCYIACELGGLQSNGYKLQTDMDGLKQIADSIDFSMLDILD